MRTSVALLAGTPVATKLMAAQAEHDRVSATATQEREDHGQGRQRRVLELFDMREIEDGPPRVRGHDALPQSDRGSLVESAFDSEDLLPGCHYPGSFHELRR